MQCQPCLFVLISEDIMRTVGVGNSTHYAVATCASCTLTCASRLTSWTATDPVPQVQNLIEMPQNDHLPLLEASRCAAGWANTPVSIRLGVKVSCR